MVGHEILGTRPDEIRDRTGEQCRKVFFRTGDEPIPRRLGEISRCFRLQGRSGVIARCNDRLPLYRDKRRLPGQKEPLLLRIDR